MPCHTYHDQHHVLSVFHWGAQDTQWTWWTRAFAVCAPCTILHPNTNLLPYKCKIVHQWRVVSYLRDMRVILCILYVRMLVCMWVYVSVCYAPAILKSICVGLSHYQHGSKICICVVCVCHARAISLLGKVRVCNEWMSCACVWVRGVDIRCRWPVIASCLGFLMVWQIDALQRCVWVWQTKWHAYPDNTKQQQYL